MVQSCPEASPAKWHQDHTTWFFETFVLRPFLADYKPFREEFHRLFNSYYISLGEEIPEKKLRASFSHPPLDEVLAFRAYAAGRQMLRRRLRPIPVRVGHSSQIRQLVIEICPLSRTDTAKGEQLRSVDRPGAKSWCLAFGLQ